ncbi:MAG: cysteine desulfurase [Clostridiales bacterium]|nr:cysteine desulfurase [Clostridiales bacterium]
MEIYLDYAASTPLDEEVLNGMLPYFSEEFGNSGSLHAFGRRAAYAVETARERVAATLGVKPKEVFFTSGGTESNNWAVQRLGEGSVCISAIEHKSVSEAAKWRKGGFTVAPCGADGIVTAEHVKSALTADTGLVAIMAVNNETGCIQPLREISALCKEKGLPLFSDCVQAGSTLDLKEVCALTDAISLSGHKIYGPKGTGVYVVKSGHIVPLLAGGDQERGLRGGTVNTAGAVGFSLALEKVQKIREDYCKHTGEVRDLFERTVLGALKEEVKVDGVNRACNLSHITFKKGGVAFLSKLDLAGVAASGGAACSVGSARPTPVLLAMGRSEDEAQRGVRFSFGKHTTKENAKNAAELVISCYRTLG